MDKEQNQKIINDKHMFYRKYVKRFLDVFLSFIALIVLFIPLLGIAAIVRIKLGSPILFSQERIGMNEKPFKILKFRSMTNERDVNGDLLPDVQRLTKFGKLLRSTSLDELPALLNIIKGDMSIVGPRPLPVIYKPYFTKKERVRHTVRGGLTGLAQIRGRNNLSWEDKFGYDIVYVNHISFLYDAKIVFETIGKVLLRKDVGVRGIQGAGDLNKIRKNMVEEQGISKDTMPWN